ncbi:MAG TPA: mycofactocin biosynthesis glycosyltransferase MftF, partial [Acidimicrobiales bacterium]
MSATAPSDRAAELAGLRVVPDDTARRHPDDSVVVGGSPLRLLRLHPAGLRLVDRLWEGEPVPPGPAATALTRRLLDAGIVHPDWDASPALPAPFGPADVTVVIPVRGELAPRLLSQVGPVAEVVVVDDASPCPVTAPDRTSPGVPVRVVRHDSQRGPGAARTTGLEHVTTPLVAYLDADCEPEPEWLGPLLPHFADTAVAMVAPRITAAAPVGRGLVARYEAARSALDMGARPARVRARTRVGHVPSAALVARAAVLREAGGFDPTMAVGEDVDLVWRLDRDGSTVRYEPRSQVAHHHRTALWPWARRRFD